MRTSDIIDAIAPAFIAMQKVVTNPPKLHKNPHFNTKYADLSDGLDVIRPALTANDLSFTQGTKIESENMVLVTKIVHKSGQFFESDYWVARTGGKHQDIGGSMTYAKRQALFAMVGVCGDDDRDGEDGSAARGARRGNTQARGQQQTRRQADEPAGEPLPAEKSKAAADAMIETIAGLQTSADAQRWAGENRALKNSLVAADSRRVSEAWSKSQAAISARNAAADKQERKAA